MKIPEKNQDSGAPILLPKDALKADSNSSLKGADAVDQALRLSFGNSEIHRERLIEQQRRIMEVMRSITANGDVPTICRMVRDAMVNLEVFDRAGFWLVDGPELRGTWGTDLDGELTDESEARKDLAEFLAYFPDLKDLGTGYTINQRTEQRMLDGKVQRFFDQAIIPIRSGGELVAVLMVDNLLTMNPIAPESLEVTLLFCEQVAEAISKARLIAEKEAALAMERRLTFLAVAIAAEPDPDKVFRLIRHEIITIGEVDRAAIWYFDGNYARGTWGTDEQGNETDEHWVSFQIDSRAEPYTSETLWRIHPEYQISMEDGTFETCAHAMIPMSAGEAVVGLLTVDNLLTKRPLTPETIQRFLPIVRHAAIAFEKAQLLEQHQQMIAKRQRLLELAVAVTSIHDPNEIFRLARDAMASTSLVDRVGIWIADPEGFRGTWGTDSNGNRTDERDLRFERDTTGLSDYIQEVFKIGNSRSPMIFGAFEFGETSPERVPCASIALRSFGELVGIVHIDNLITRRPLTEESLEPLLPFAQQVAVAIQNGRLLQRANRELAQRQIVEDDLRRQKKDLIVARDQALAGTRARDQFLANMSHELRTPLNGVLGMTSLLMTTPLNPQQSDFARTVQSSASTLLSVIDSILEFANLESGEITLVEQSFDLRKAALEITEAMASTLENSPVELTCSIPASFPDRVVGDRERIRQVIHHLVDNAVKFTPCGRVTLDLSWAAKSESSCKIRISVQDTGIGIAFDQQSRIFQGFSQVDGSSTRLRGGLGVGLAITRRIVDKMGGTIHVHSAEGKGSTFSVDLTLSIPPPIECGNREFAEDAYPLGRG
jgi:signal transduction histidine kinase